MPTLDDSIIATVLDGSYYSAISTGPALMANIKCEFTFELKGGMRPVH